MNCVPILGILLIVGCLTVIPACILRFATGWWPWERL
jgi:hypothetical protein